MPYIDKKLRANLLSTNGQVTSKAIALGEIKTCGELNFAVTELLKAYVENQAESGSPNFMAQVRYQLINDVLGALECAKMEFYRRVAAPYEDSKIKLNGDVY